MRVEVEECCAGCSQVNECRIRRTSDRRTGTEKEREREREEECEGAPGGSVPPRGASGASRGASGASGSFGGEDFLRNF